MLVRRTMVREVFPTFQQGVEVPSCCERAILRYEKGTVPIQGNGSVTARIGGGEGGWSKLGTAGPLFAVFSHFGYFICGSYTCDNFGEKKEKCEALNTVPLKTLYKKHYIKTL